MQAKRAGRNKNIYLYMQTSGAVGGGGGGDLVRVGQQSHRRNTLKCFAYNLELRF